MSDQDVDKLVSAMAGLTAALEQSRRATPTTPGASGPDLFTQMAFRALQENPEAGLKDVFAASMGQKGSEVQEAGAVAELREEVAGLKVSIEEVHQDLLKIGRAMLALASQGLQGDTQDGPSGGGRPGDTLAPLQPEGPDAAVAPLSGSGVSSDVQVPPNGAGTASMSPGDNSKE